VIGTDTIGGYLGRLSAREPTPGGGAAGALHAAQAAALIGMVARYSTGPQYAAHAQDCDEIQARADAHRDCSLRLADADAAAFQGVIAAYQLPRASPEETAARSSAIQDALLAAADPPRSLVGVARGVVTLGERLADFANPSVISDVAAAAEAARAAAATARVNLDINLTGITDPERRASLEAAVADSDEAIHVAEALSARVRQQILA
jgi:formiminotetrahydrofolate cyclodeaminase